LPHAVAFGVTFFLLVVHLQDVVGCSPLHRFRVRRYWSVPVGATLAERVEEPSRLIDGDDRASCARDRREVHGGEAGPAADIDQRVAVAEPARQAAVL
jgi:hypothetical protein